MEITEKKISTNFNSMLWYYECSPTTGKKGFYGKVLL